MRKRNLLERAVRAFFRLPEWLRPAVVAGGIVLVIMIPRVWKVLPDVLSGRVATSESWLALAAGPAAGFLAGLVHGVSRPRLRRLGRVGDYLSGIVVLYAYLGALIAASPFVFERSAIPEDAQGWWIWIAMATVLGLVAGHAWFGGPEGLDRLIEQRSQPQVQRMLAEEGDATAALVSGWVRSECVGELLERLASATGARLAAGEPARLIAAVAALRAEDEEREEAGVEWSLSLTPPVRMHFVPEDALVMVEVLLEGENERHLAAVREVLAARTVDPLAA